MALQPLRNLRKPDDDQTSNAAVPKHFVNRSLGSSVPLESNLQTLSIDLFFDPLQFDLKMSRFLRNVHELQAALTVRQQNPRKNLFLCGFSQRKQNSSKKLSDCNRLALLLAGHTVRLPFKLTNC